MATERQDYEKRLKDPIQYAIGDGGLWQTWVCAVIFLQKFPIAWHSMAILFVSPPVSFECVEPAGVEKCSNQCKEVEFNRSVFEETIVTEWVLVCDKAFLSNLSQTIVMLGILIGNYVFGIWADKHGRKMPLVVAVIIQTIAGVLCAWVPWFWAFCILKFITSVATGGTMSTSFVIIMEIIGPKWREFVSVVYQVPFYMGHLTLPLFAYFLRNWRHFQFAISIASVPLFSYYWIVPESPRWLYTTGKMDRAVKILETAAKQNKLPIENIRSDLDEANKRKAKEIIQTKGNVTDLFRTPNLCKKSVIMNFNWFVCGLAFYGVVQYMGQIGGDIFVNVSVGAAVEIPGVVICIIMLKCLGRKITLISSNIFSGVAMLCIALVPPEMKWAIVGLSSLGVIGMSVAFPTAYLYAGELFPTVVRNSGIGLCSVSARVGSMVAPFVAGMGVSNRVLSSCIFGIIPLVGALTVFCLPETRGFPLPETIDDGESFGMKKKTVVAE